MGTWVPVAFAAVIVIGVVGGQLAQMVLKELLPLLRTIAEQRQQAVPAADLARIADTIATLDRRLDRLEATCNRLEEDRRFTRELLVGRTPDHADPALRGHADPALPPDAADSARSGSAG